MANEYLGSDKGPIRVVYVTEVRFKGCESIKTSGRGRRQSLIIKVERTTKRTTENLSFRQKDAAVLVQAVALALRDTGYRGKEFGSIHPQPPPTPVDRASPPRRCRRTRTLTLESLIGPGVKVKQVGGMCVLEDPKQVEPEVASFVQGNVERIFQPIERAGVAAELLGTAKDEVRSMAAVLVTALHSVYAIHDED